MKKVFHIISHFDVGGAERVAVNIAKSKSEGFEYHVVELVRARSRFTRVFVEELRAAGIHYHRCMVPDIRFRYVFYRFAAFVFPLWFLPLFLRHRPAVIHSHTEMPDLAVSWFFTLFPKLLVGCKVVRTIHNTTLWTGMKPTGRRVERFFKTRATNVAISCSVRDNYERDYGQRTPIIYNGVAETAQRPYEGIKKNKINILFAGRLEPQKGIKTLVGIVKAVKDDSRLHFHIIGDGSMKGYVEGELGSLGNVTLSPPVSGLSAFLASFDYLLMPSEFEGLPLMSIEASLAGLPVIANRCPGLYETLPDDWPLLVYGNDLNQYAAIFRRLEGGRASRRLGLVARDFASARFGIRRMQTAYEALYAY